MPPGRRSWGLAPGKAGAPALAGSSRCRCRQEERRERVIVSESQVHAGSQPEDAAPAASEVEAAQAEAGEAAEAETAEATGAAEAEDDEAEEDEADPVEAYTAELRQLPGDWYVVHSYAGYENRVKGNLESRTQSLN